MILLFRRKKNGLIDVKQNCKNSSTVTQIINGAAIFQTAVVYYVSSSEINYVKWFFEQISFEEEKKHTTVNWNVFSTCGPYAIFIKLICEHNSPIGQKEKNLIEKFSQSQLFRLQWHGRCRGAYHSNSIKLTD